MFLYGSHNLSSSGMAQTFVRHYIQQNWDIIPSRLRHYFLKTPSDPRLLKSVETQWCSQDTTSTSNMLRLRQRPDQGGSIHGRGETSKRPQGWNKAELTIRQQTNINVSKPQVTLIECNLLILLYKCMTCRNVKTLSVVKACVETCSLIMFNLRCILLTSRLKSRPSQKV